MATGKLHGFRVDVAILLLLALNLASLFERLQLASTILSSRDLIQASSYKERFHPNSSPLHKSSWIGDYWIPLSAARQRFYSAQEMRQFFANESILFVGDSTARRAYATLYHILNSTDQEDYHNLRKSQMDSPNIIDINKKGAPQETCETNSNLALCRRLPQNPSRHVDLFALTCNSQLLPFLEGFDTSAYTVVVVAYGAWHQSFRCQATVEDQLFLKTNAGANLAVQSMTQQQRLERHNLTIVWRTMGLPEQPTTRMVSQIRRINRFVSDGIQRHQEQYRNQTGHSSSLTTLDWGSVMEPRTINRVDRIRGDLKYHYGFESRLVFLQLLMHHLIAKRQQQQQDDDQERDSSWSSMATIPRGDRLYQQQFH